MPQQSSYTDILNHKRSIKSKKLIVLGASGSVGESCMDFLKLDGTIEPVAISVHRSIEKLHDLLSSFTIANACITNESCFDLNIDVLKTKYPDVSFFRGQSGVLDMIKKSFEFDQADTILTAVVGAIGIEATMLSLKLGLKIALANKETMVTAGPAIQELIRNQVNARKIPPVILPVDSEHNAVFQLVQGQHQSHIEKIILTASGGPFRGYSAEKIKQVNRQEVLNHPTWSMGPKITVDSAGMINKGLEIIEAHFLFSVPYSKLDVLIHPDSLVHAMVQTTDGGYLMCMSQPHMVFPIAHALYYPDALPSAHLVSTTPDSWNSIEFEKVNPDSYRGFWIALEAGKTAGTAPAIFNAANEVAVELFLKGAIGFTKIPELIERVLDKSKIQDTVLLNDFLIADEKARILAKSIGKNMD